MKGRGGGEEVGRRGDETRRMRGGGPGEVQVWCRCGAGDVQVQVWCR